jgi:hypothetical protein
LNLKNSVVGFDLFRLLLASSQENARTRRGSAGRAKENNRMFQIQKLAHQRNPKSRPQASAERVWSTDHPLNACEFLRVELRAAVDVRRRRKPSASTTRSTEKGFAISARHMQALKDLIQATIAQAEVDGLLEASRSVSEGAS